MDPQGQWLQSPSGSRAEAPWQDEWNTFQPNAQTMQTTMEFVDHNDWNWNDVFTSFEEGQDEEEVAALLSSAALGVGDLPHGAVMSTKVPPAWNGRGSWFAYEELVNDWEDVTVLEKSQRGPALRNRLQEEAVVYKQMLDRTKLKDENEGVEYFLKTLRPEFVKGVHNVFLHRLFQFMSFRRGRLEISRWIAKYSLMKKRLNDAWMDLNVVVTRETPGVDEQLATLRTAMGTDYPSTPEDQLKELNDRQRAAHAKKFPFSDNLSTLIFIVASQLHEQQRTLLTSHLSMRQLKMQDYTWEPVRSLYMELLCAPKSSLEDLSIRSRTDFRGARTFLVLDGLGECEGATGYWAEEQETGTEGFLEEYNDSFWIFDETSNTWYQKRFRGRQYIKGRPKGKGKGRKGRPRFRRHGKGRSSGKGRPYVATEQDNDWSNWTWNDQQWQSDLQWSNADPYSVDSSFKGSGKPSKGKGKGKGKFSKGKGKTKGKFKSKFGKSKDSDHQVDSANQSQATEWPIEDWQAWATQLEWQLSEYQSWYGEDQTWSDQSWSQSDWTEAGNGFLATCHATSEQGHCFTTRSGCPCYSWAGNDDYDWNRSCDSSLRELVDIRKNPTYVILDLGCTRSMGSLRAVNAFCDVAWKYGIEIEWKECWTHMSFANSKSEWLQWCVVVHFQLIHQ